uniref:Uncharacterized protein n=1 Tax=Amphora coffeiformis TaxID=265554 RepID=A0A7S3P9H9_9STRA|mmetsp:Transcript_9262/g.17718  ORF Transcript_9262/g.17718 Transcript_9262/m.17718 type:complete len:302 (+) Transcript_9262:100-1005(+)|eukprot:scaffold10723_cov164-Amphora_coffeaeformis.AAC.4
MKSFLLLVVAAPFCKGFSAAVGIHRTPSTRTVVSLAATTLAAEPAEISYALSSALKKASKTLSVVLEVGDDKNVMDDNDVSMLSMQLRKLKASALFTSNAEVAALLVAEQITAKGSFPGPCPVIYSGSLGVANAGVTAVVMGKDDDTTAPIPEGVDAIRRVTCVQDVADGNLVGVYLVDVIDNDVSVISAILEQISPSAITILAVDSMQAANAEIHTTKAVVAAHPGRVHAILLKQAIIGDAEDLPYATFVVDALTKKKSSAFNMSGLTGSTNGHFGGVAASSSRPVTWRRQQLQQQTIKK